MAKIAELPIQRSDGQYDYVDLHDPGTFSHDPFLVQTSSGAWGAPYLQPLGEGDTGLLVQDSAGNWWQFSKRGIEIIEDWSVGYLNTDRWNWTDEDFTGSSEVTGTRTLYGDQSLHLMNYRVTAAMPDYPDPAPGLPVEVGDRLEFHWQMPHSDDINANQQYWFGFLVQEAPHHSTTSAGSVHWDNLYTAEAITGTNDLFRISERVNGNRDPYSSGRTTVDWRAGVWYRGYLVIESDGMRVEVYRHIGGDSWVYEGTATGPAPNWSSGGILIRSGGDDGESYWSTIRKSPS